MSINLRGTEVESISFSQITKGTLAIATPDIDSGIFFRAVVLICEHTAAGSFGLIINKTLDFEMPQEILNPLTMSNPHVSVRVGGPVQTNQMMLVHNSRRIPDQTMRICNGVYLGGDLAFLQKSAAAEKGPQIHLCFGYAGWAAGQLEKECLEGSWFLHPASHERVFNVPADKLWQTLLREMGGRFATLSMIPEDLSLN